MSCKHETLDDFSIKTEHRRFWICSNCGKKEPWGESWGYYGNVECKECCRADISWVSCSDECKKQLSNVD